MSALLLALAGTVLAVGMTAGLIRDRLWLSEPMLAVAVGLVLGPVTGLIHLGRLMDEHVLLEHTARLTLAVAVTNAALRLPHGPLSPPLRRSIAVMLLIVMPAMWLVSSGLSGWLLDLPLLVALMVGAVVTPTDPVLSNSIITGDLAREHVPEDLRHLITAESAANDGLALPFVLLPVLLFTHPGEGGWGRWAMEAWVAGLGLTVVLGLAMGWGTARALDWARRHKLTGQSDMLTVAISLAFTVTALASLLGANDILAVFIAGLAFNRTLDPSEELEEEKFQETAKRTFEFPIFVLFGLAAPLGAWAALGWHGIALCILILLLRRLPWVMLTKRGMPVLKTKGQVLFTGWFGPIGVAATFYAMIVDKRTGLGEVWEVASLVIFASILAHGITSTPFTRHLR
ncbi:cation:proton antiporter [Telmatospirillum sp. J64-1]|uniref:cation:proton antiporter domain-containing protein n=1 Tax=Telmatospirillum sp. J64-1 TaxID=2502183 RepID=UPI00115F2513|nr:cation:proton antiporter [Telmatospirillum sp. J64-1]